LVAGIAEQWLHLSPALNLPSLSACLGERPQYISQTLSQRLHTTFFDFINQARIEEAQRMLVDTDLSVLDIALACGFKSR
jgi:AraC-like DNA-binding protein